MNIENRCMRLFRTGLLALAPAAAFAQGAGAPAELDALVKAAKAEGEIMFYTGATENIAKRTGDAFTAKYGIKVNFIRTPGVVTIQRFATEAEAGTFAADFFFVASGLNEFTPNALKRGWIETIAQAGIPAVKSGEFPARFVVPHGNSAIVQVAPWGISYNKEKLKGGDVPKDWGDLLHPRFKGQLLVPDPKSSDAYSDFWGLLIDKMGESYLTRLREQSLRIYQSGVPSTNALAAGEGMIAFPAVGGQVAAVVDKGAPLAMTQPPIATGVEMQVTMTNRARAKHPNAGRLFVHFVMTPEGNRIFNSDPGSLSVYDVSGLPKGYESPKPGALARRELIAKLLGTQ